jgi:hypothetical protein
MEEIVMENDKLYKKRLNYIMNNVEQPEKIRDIIIKKIIPDIPEKNSMMDIGAGKGDYTLPLLQFFKHICFVEPNHIFCEELAKAILLSGKIVTAYKGIWEDFEAAEQEYDMIICIHVLYYILGEKNLTEAIRKMIASMKSGGKIVIVLSSETSDTALSLFKLFPEYNIPSSFAENVAECIRNLGISYELITLTNPISAPAFEDFTEILALMMNGEVDVEYIRSKASIIDENFKTEDIYQVIQTAHVMILSV